MPLTARQSRSAPGLPGAAQTSIRISLLAAACALLAACAEDRAKPGAATPDYEARITRTSFGVAHIEAADFGSLGYGEAYAAAEDHVCNIAYGMLEARGEKARYFGAGDKGSNVAVDAVVRALEIPTRADAAFAAQPARIQRWLEGYSAGFNRYLEEHRGEAETSWCAGAPWLLPTRPQDYMARALLLVQTLPRMSGALAAAQPPTPAAGVAGPNQDVLLAALDSAALPGMGSNGWALGAAMSENGRGLLLANPHYPWYGGNRFWEKHLRIPGQLDVYGAQLLGAPGVAIGFNSAVGWTHTVSASQRLVLYRLRLVDGEPLRYHYGDETRAIEGRDVDIEVLGADGELTTRRQTIYFSHHGPLLNLPGATWDTQFAYAARDANAENTRLMAQWLSMGEARDLDEFIAAHAEHNALPWVNTMATSADGRAVFLDNSTVGRLSDEAQQAWRESLAEDRLAAGLYQQRGLVLLDGSDARTEWIDDGNAPIPGTTPFKERPLLERDDYIFNSNDSYWLSSPRAPMDGYSVLYGPTETARSLRTRMNIRMLENTYGDAGPDGRFSIAEVQEALFSNRGLGAELLREPLVDACAAAARDDTELTAACDVLENYDGTLNLDSPGAVLFREWITRYERSDTTGAGKLFAEAFDPARPAETPSGLADPIAAVEQLRGAIAVLAAADLPLDATLRDTQFAYRGGNAIPVHGGNGFEGVANLQESGRPDASPIAGVTTSAVRDSRQLTDVGYPVVHGSSFIMTLAFTDAGPVAEALLSYSQSGDPTSAHFADQTTLYRDKRWRPVHFSPAAVAADMQSTMILTGPRSAQSP